MRKKVQGPVLEARAIAGTYVVVLAWNFAAGQDHKHNGLMGFAIERTEFDKNGNEVERYWMRSIKRFREKDQGLPAGTPVSTADHPIQSFQWADYTAQTDRNYRYKIVPAYGPVKNLVLDDASSVSVDISTEIEFLLNPNTPNNKARHDVYFNRGVIGSQAFARRFGNATPDSSNPGSEEMVWLSRGLFEALIRPQLHEDGLA